MNPYIFWVTVVLILLSTILSVFAFVKKSYLAGCILLLPIVFVVIIICSIGAEMKSWRPSKIGSCKAGLRGVQSALELYNTHYKYYPEKLETPISEGYLQETGDVDPWGNKLNYIPIYSADKKKVVDYMLRSNGPDGKPYTGDDIATPMKPENLELKK